jgi:multicomponent Na+:H+ antiporter subunit C
VTAPTLYALAGVALFTLGLLGFLLRRHLLRRIVALNVMGGGALLVFCAMAARGGGPPDPVPQALALTGIVVALAVTALALAITLRFHAATGRLALEPELPGEPRRPQG